MTFHCDVTFEAAKNQLLTNAGTYKVDNSSPVCKFQIFQSVNGNQAAQHAEIATDKICDFGFSNIVRLRAFTVGLITMFTNLRVGIVTNPDDERLRYAA